MTAMKYLDFLNSFSYCIILQLTWAFASSKTVLYGPQFSCQYLIEKSIHLLSLWQLKHSLYLTIFVT